MVAFLFVMLKILQLDKNSIAEKIGLQKDDVIVAFDGQRANDMLDVAYFDSQSDFQLTVDRDGQSLIFCVQKPAYQPMGWDFYDESYIEPRWCANKCVFCFVDQLPKGQRPTLYVKDDDWRLSFVSGNYVTLTNISDAEIDRILDKKFSPLYVSVHATDDCVRKMLLGNQKARPIMPLLKRLADGGITMFTQVVMCPNLNDGAILKQTLADLYSLYPAVKNVAIVPVGLTKHRSQLSKIEMVSEAVANETVNTVECFDQKCFQQNGEHFAYCSDEMYIFAKRQLPSHEYYGDFDQLENGVGIVADTRYQFHMALQQSKKAKKGSFTIVTGVSAAPILQQLVEQAKEKHPKLKANVLPVTNQFFGESVTVAGLVVGQDIVSALKNATNVGDTLLLPRVMLREIEDVFLDGMTLQQLKKISGKKIQIVADGYELCQALLECD